MKDDDDVAGVRDNVLVSNDDAPESMKKPEPWILCSAIVACPTIFPSGASVLTYLTMEMFTTAGCKVAIRSAVLAAGSSARAGNSVS